MHFNRHLAYWAQRTPDAKALVCEGQSLTWAQLDRASASLAAYLAEVGIGPGDRFGCLLDNSLEWCVAFAAAIRNGATFVPFNPMFGRFELEEIARDAECMAVFSRPSEITKLGAAAGEIPAATDDAIRLYDLRGAGAAPVSWSVIEAAGRPFTDHRLSDDEPLCICYTSGTTGVPKGILHTHRSIDTMVQGLNENFGWTPGGERCLILAPLAFTGTVICVLSPMLAMGACTFIEKRIDPTRALDLIVDHRLTYFAGVPALFERVALAPRFAEADISCITSANAGGAPVSRTLLETYLAKGVVVRQQYGASEAGGCIASPTREMAIARPDACGHGLATFDIEIRDDSGKKVPNGEVGEIHIRGPQMMQRYWRKPEATAEAFDGDWYKTGDLGKYEADAGLIVVDRKKNMLISGGVNVYPAEVERGIAAIPGVEEVAVIGVPSAQWGDEVVAVVYAPDLNDGEALLRAARDLLGNYKTPKRVAFSPSPLPRTATNKIARKGLDQVFAELTAAQTAPAL